MTQLMELGLRLMIIIVTINAALLVFGVTGGNSNELLGWLPTGLDHENLNPNDTSIGSFTTPDGNMEIGHEQSAGMATNLAGNIFGFFNSLIALIFNLLFGYVFALLLIIPIGSPLAPIVYILCVPIAAIQLITIIWIAMSFISAVTGALR